MRKLSALLGTFTAIIGLSAHGAEVINQITGTQTASENGCSFTTPTVNADDCSYSAGDPLGAGSDGWIGPVDKAATYAPGTAPAGSTSAGFQGSPGDGRGLLAIAGLVTIDDIGNGCGADDVISWTYTIGAGQRHVATGAASSATEGWTSVTKRLSPVTATSAVPNAGGCDYTFGQPVTPLDPDGTINSTPFPSDVASTEAGPFISGTSAWTRPTPTPISTLPPGPVIYSFQSNCIDPIICAISGATGPFGTLFGELTIFDSATLADGVVSLGENVSGDLFSLTVRTDTVPDFFVDQRTAEEFVLTVDANGNITDWDFHSDVTVAIHLVWSAGSTSNPLATHNIGSANAGLGVNCDDEPFVAFVNCGFVANPIADGWIWTNPIVPIPGTSIVNFEGNAGVQEDLEMGADIVGYTCDDGGALPADPGCTAGSSALLGSNAAILGGDPEGSFAFENVVGMISTDATGAIVAAQLFGVQESDDDAGLPGADSWSATILSFTGTVIVCEENVQAIDDAFGVINEALPVDLDVLLNDFCKTDPPITVVSPPPAGDLMPSQGGTAVVELGATDITYTPQAGDTGPEIFTYTAEDAGIAGSMVRDRSTAMVTVTLFADIQPIAGDGAASGSPGAPVIIDVANIPGTSLGNTEVGALNGGAVVPVTVTVPPINGSTSVAGTVVSYTTPSEGVESFMYKITDANGDTSPIDGTITVTIVNKLPVANNASAPAIDTRGLAPGSQTSSLDITAIAGNDFGDQPSTVSAGNGAGGTATVSGTTVTYTPNSDFFAGTDTFEYTITDAQGDMSTAMITVTLTDAQPAAGAALANTNQDLAVEIDLGASVTLGNGDELAHAFTVTANPGNGVVTMSSPIAVYTPEAGFFGTDSFEYTVTDGDGSSASGVVTVNVVEVQPPRKTGSSGVGPLSMVMLLLLAWVRRRGTA